MKRFPWFEAALVILVMVIHLYAASSDAHNFPGSWFTRDDAYYYFKVAQNISEGHGSSFDGLNPTNGYHPLWMLVCIPIFALARFDLILPLRILLLVQGAFSAATAVLLYRLIKPTLSKPAAIVAASWWAFNSYIHYTIFEFGLETGLAVFNLTLLIYALTKFELEWRTKPLTRRRLAGLAILALLTLLSRLDLVFLALLAGAWIILRGTRLRVLLPADVMVAVVSGLAAFVSRLGLPAYYAYSYSAIAMIIISVSTKIPLYFAFGLYQPLSTHTFVRSLRAILLTVSASTLITGIGTLAIANAIGSFPRTALIYDWVINLVGVVLVRALALVFSRSDDMQANSARQTLRARGRQWLHEAWIYYGILGAGLALYMSWNQIVIGTALPVSGQIKRWWGEFASRVYGGSARDPLSFWGAGFQNDFDAWRPLSFAWQDWSGRIAAWRGSYRPEDYYAIVILSSVLIALAIFLIDRRLTTRAAVQLGLPILFIASFAQVLSYNISGYASMKEWYWISQPLLLVLAGSALAAILLRRAKRIPFAQPVLFATAILMSFGMALDFGKVTVQRMPHGVHSEATPYLDAVQFLEENTPPGAVIGMTGGGNVGYYIHGRTIVNMDGLINGPAYFHALRSGQASIYLSELGTNYVFANPEILKGPPYRGQFKTGPPVLRYGGKALMELLP